MELAQSRLLPDQEMQGLVAEGDVGALRCQRQVAAAGVHQFDRQPVAPGLLARALERLGLDVDADQALRAEALLQQPERAAEAAADIDRHGIGFATILDQPLEVGDRAREHMHGPGIGSQEPLAEARLGHVRHVGDTPGQDHRKPQLIGSVPGQHPATVAAQRPSASRLTPLRVGWDWGIMSAPNLPEEDAR